MFGQPDDQTPNEHIPDQTIDQVLDDQTTAPPNEVVKPTPDEPAADATPDPAPVSEAAHDAPTADPAPGDDAPWQHPGTPIDEPATDPGPDPAPDPAPISDVISPAGGFPQPPQFPSAPLPPAPDPQPLSTATSIDEESAPVHALLDIKQHALEELEPLIDQLDQSPEEKFRTIMMMIQATDDQSLVTKAYDSAHAIEDEKVRARALFDIVNEINYFTQPHPDAQS